LKIPFHDTIIALEACILLKDLFYEILSNYEFRFGKIVRFDYDKFPHSHSITDPLYGEVHLSKFLQYLTSLPIIERLSMIRQLALTNLVFSGANHTRLEHSLGVSHLLNIIPDDLTDIDKTILGIVGLLHDLGHSGWGHALDGLVAKVATEALGPREKFPKFALRKLDIAITSYLLYYNDQLVEALSTIAEKLGHWDGLYLNKEPRLLRDLVAWIISEEEYGYKFFCKGEYWSEISDVLINRSKYFQRLLGHDINCDRLDWVERDGHHAFSSRKDFMRLLQEISRLKHQLKVKQDRCSSEIMCQKSLLRELNKKVDKFRRKLYEEVYEGIERSFIDSLLNRIVYSGLLVLANVGNYLASPSAKGRVIMGYIFSPDEQLTYYTEKILEGACFPSIELPEMPEYSTAFIKRSYSLFKYLFRNLRGVLSIVREQYRKRKKPTGVLTSKDVGQLVIDERIFNVFYLDAEWFVGKVLHFSVWQTCTLMGGLPKHEALVWHKLNEFFGDVRTDVVTVFNTEEVEFKINKLLRVEYGTEIEFILLPNYYFFRRLTDDLPKLTRKLINLIAKNKKRNLFDEFEKFIAKNYKKVPLFFFIVQGQLSDKILKEIEDSLSSHITDLLGKWLTTLMKHG
jgi:HD superfamily phosphohydrolase